MRQAITPMEAWLFDRVKFSELSDNVQRTSDSLRDSFVSIWIQPSVSEASPLDFGSLELPINISSLQPIWSDSDSVGFEVNFNQSANRKVIPSIIEIDSNQSKFNHFRLPKPNLNLNQPAFGTSVPPAANPHENQTMSNDSSVNQPVGLKRWPQNLLDPEGEAGEPDIRIELKEIETLSDASQQALMKTDLLAVEGKICFHEEGGRALYTDIKAPQTLTETHAMCYEVQDLHLQDQHRLLAAAYRVLLEGQDLYGAAAFNGTVLSCGQVRCEGRGQFWTKLLPVPKKPYVDTDWPKDSIRLKVPDQPDLRMQLDSDHILGPTEDNWGSYWFHQLCREAFIKIKKMPGSPNLPMETFSHQLSPDTLQLTNVQFIPLNVPGAQVVTRGMLLDVLKGLVSVYNEYGARPLRISLLNDKDGHIGVGYVEYGQLPPGLGSANATAVYSTEAIATS